MFTDFALHKLLLKAVHDLGYRQPTAVQEEVIPLALEGVDLRIAAETGSGKTAAFLLPTLNQLLSRRGHGTRVLVLLPTRELAQQVFAVCEALARHTNLKRALVCGGDEFATQVRQLGDDPAVVVATPGRLLAHLKLGAPDLTDLEVLVIDEADRMLDMGFRDAVLDIVGHCNPLRQTLLCSATLGHKDLGGLAGAVLREPQAVTLSTVRDRHSSIRHQKLLADDWAHKGRLLAWLLAHEAYDKALVFTNSRLQADKVGAFLIENGEPAGVLHGEMDQPQRNRVLALLREGAVRVVVATDVAGRGLDIEGIGLVVNFDVPRRGDIYVHRTGRTGRAGEQGSAVSLVSPQEWNLAASIERYLHQRFEPRVIDGLRGSYTGPKKLKSSGKAVRGKKKRPGGRS